MAIDTLTQLNDLITNGTMDERLAFKNIIVSGLNAQDLADIITSSTRAQKEALAILIVQSQNFLNDTNNIDAQNANDASVAIAQSWYDSTVLPLLVWNSGQSLTIQRSNSLLDRATIQGFIGTETDGFRLFVLKQKFKDNLTQFKAIKVAIIAGS